MNMQNSPLLVAPPSPVKSATTSQQPNKMAEKVAEGKSFKQVLSKQVEQETPQKTDNKSSNLKHQSDAKEAALVTSGNNSTKEDSIDAQLLASTVVAKNIEDATDGEVVLDTLKSDALKETSALPPQLANMMVALQPNKAGEDADVKLKNTVDDVLSKMKKPSVDVKAQAAVKNETDPAKGKLLDGLVDSGKVESNQFSQHLVGEKNAQFVKDASITQSMTAVTDTSALATMAVQATAKPFAQSVPTTEQVGFSNLIHAAPGKTGWNEAIGQKVVWMVGAAEQSATLTLNPKDLGPLQVIINVNNEKADATFISENPEVRKALEDGMSNLKQSMGQAGVELGQANVNTSKQHQAFQESNREQLGHQNTDGSSAQSEEQVNGRARAVRQSSGLVDTFA